ncbi:MAG: LTA synthase family protein [Clostridia bacterium]|nr:LTA synthase family protein [Clostridia bacterium]
MKNETPMKSVMKNVFNKIWEWIKINRLVVIYFFLAILIEMSVVFSVEKTPFMTRPFLGLGLLIALAGVLLLLPNNMVKLIVGTVMLVVQTALDFIFAAIYDMTGQYFDLDMFSLRNDAVSALEKIPVNFVAFYIGFLACVLFIIFGLRSLHMEAEQTEKKPKKYKHGVWFYIGTVVAGIATLFGSFMVYYPAKTDKYHEMVYSQEDGVYSSYGLVGNLLGEIGNAFKGDKVAVQEAQAEPFLYAKTSQASPAFGVAKDKNVVVILSESLEWFAFMRNEEHYNALDITPEELAAFYPNLTRFYNESVIASNFHSREKTDISETTSLIGAYPTGQYVNTSYYQNVLPNTLPNIMKALDSDLQAKYFHNGEKEFYNRDEATKTFGFESIDDRYSMEEKANQAVIDGKTQAPTFINYKDNPVNSELCLDSEMIETCKDDMFPTDKRFYTYITTITMHGTYYARDNLTAEREAFEALLGEERVEKIYDKEGADDLEDVLFYYMVTAKELDDAMGVMFEDLEKKNLLDNTLILMFGDHNAYYNQLSNYVKDIKGYNTEHNFTDLYKVPLMIHGSGLPHQIIDKFMCTSDIVPTLLDLLGIRYYSNFYYGNSLFAQEQSIMYSRAYGIFLRDGIVGTSATNVVFRYEGEEDEKGVVQGAITDADVEAFERDGAALVEKIKYCDYWFKTDYFAQDNNKQTYIDKMKTLNGQ